ncbi:MAG: FAD-dependent oxidoreductase [Armatimonadetes bacterium]|nr:FAD-dependent oxidoreductase [Armatimonadota bacterium]
MRQPTQTTRVEAIRALSPHVREIVLAPPPEPVRFRPGQWISLHLPVGEKPPLVRAYTLSAPEDPSGRLVLCLDRVSSGLGSEYLFRVRPGDELTFVGPLGNFVLPEPLTQDVVFAARYTGIMPIRCMLLDLQRRPLPVDVTLVYGGPSREELIYHEGLAAYAAREPRFHYHPTLLRPSPGWCGPVGEELHLLHPLLGGRPPDYLPMVCGIKEFARPVRTFFQEQGFERRQVKVETYD